MRFNIAAFTQHMGNPHKELYVLDKDDYRRIKGERVYHLNMVLKYGGKRCPPLQAVPHRSEPAQDQAYRNRVGRSRLGRVAGRTAKRRSGRAELSGRVRRLIGMARRRYEYARDRPRAGISYDRRSEKTMSEPRTLFDKIWDDHVVERQDDGTCVLYIDRHLVHEVTSPQAFEGLRTAGRTAAPAGRDAGRRRPQRADDGPCGRYPGSGFAHPGRNAGEELRRVRHRVRPDGRYPPGHRPYHRAGTGHDPAGHDHRVRRFPYLDPRRLRGLGFRHRHVRGGACAGDADAVAAAAQEHAHHRRRRARSRHRAQGPDPRDHRRNRHGGRHRPRHRVRRRGDAGAVDGRAHDGLQHDHRGGRARRPDRARRDHLRLRQRASDGAEGGCLGTGGRLLEDVAVGPGRQL